MGKDKTYHIKSQKDKISKMNVQQSRFLNPVINFNIFSFPIKNIHEKSAENHI